MKLVQKKITDSKISMQLLCNNYYGAEHQGIFVMGEVK